jgi:hypothetical protein
VQRLFRRLAVLIDGCTYKAAVAVCDVDPDTLQSLVDNGLVRRRDDDAGGRCWALALAEEECGSPRLDREAPDAHTLEDPVRPRLFPTGRDNSRRREPLASTLDPIEEERLSRISLRPARVLVIALLVGLAVVAGARGSASSARSRLATPPTRPPSPARAGPARLRARRRGVFTLMQRSLDTAGRRTHSRRVFAVAEWDVCGGALVVGPSLHPGEALG